MLSSASPPVALVAIAFFLLLALVFYIGRATNFRRRGPFDHLPKDVGIWLPPGSFPPQQPWPPQREVNSDAVFAILVGLGFLVAVVACFSLGSAKLDSALVTESDVKRAPEPHRVPPSTYSPKPPSSTPPLVATSEEHQRPPVHVVQEQPKPATQPVRPAYFATIHPNRATNYAEICRLTGGHWNVYKIPNPTTKQVNYGIELHSDKRRADVAYRAFLNDPEYAGLRNVCDSDIRFRDFTDEFAKQRQSGASAE